MRKEYDFHHAKRGQVLPTAKGKTRITIRLDNDVLKWFRTAVHAIGGGNYQKLINEALHTYIHNQREHEPLESVVRRIVREELQGEGATKHLRKRATVADHG